MKLSESQINQIVTYLQDKPVTKAWLFGSYARGEANDASDIDLLVDLDFSKRIGLGYFGMWLDLEKMLHKKIDLVSTDGVSKYVLPFIEKDKQLIYERNYW